ncbi:MAG: amidase [Gammaproteobacteria bacterium]|nr:amidase [Gammaproteobacteria bacterium]
MPLYRWARPGMLHWDHHSRLPLMDIHRLSLSDVTRRVKSGALNAERVTEAMLERIARLDPELGAYVVVLADRAMERAHGLDDAMARGEAPGPLQGATVALKDLLSTRGIPTTCGTTVLADWRPHEDATVVERLEAAGAIVVGKVKLTEGAYGEHHPSVEPPINPWRANRWTGVSSSGSGVAVAAGLAHGAIGTDTGGSIRFPSAACGLVGIKPTYGRVSRHGVFPLADSLDHVGPMTRTVEDAARMLGVMAGHDPRDATSLDVPVPTYTALLREGLDDVRIGIDWSYVTDDVDVSVVQTVRDALGVLTALGAETVELRLPDHTDLTDNWVITCGADCARAHAATYPARKDEYGPALAGLIETGLAASEEAYERLEQERTRFRAGLDAVLEGVDAMIAPCQPTPIAHAERSPPPDSDTPRQRFIRFTAPFDYSGHPSITLPLDVDSDGLPRAFQLIGRHLDEEGLVGIGSAFERAAGFDYPTLD